MGVVGESFGEFALLDHKPRSASAQAVSDVTLIKVSEAGYQELLEELPGWASSMLRSFAHRLKKMTQILKDSSSLFNGPNLSRNLMSLKSDWYQQHLNRVSRSFAFGISELHEPLREYVGFAYLFCRLIDTVEDSTWVKVEDQKRQFLSLTSYLEQCPSEETFSLWRDQMPEEIPEGERILLEDSYRLIEGLPCLALKSSRNTPRTTENHDSRDVEICRSKVAKRGSPCGNS